MSGLVISLLDRVDEISLVLTLTLAHFVWQGFLIAIVFALANQFLRTKPANIRYVKSISLFRFLSDKSWRGALIAKNQRIKTRAFFKMIN